MASATVGLAAGVLLAEPIADLLGLGDANLVRAGFVGIWAQMNYEQLTSLFRAEERSTAFVLASLANIAVTIAATLLLVVVWEQGRARCDRRQLRRHAHGLSRPPRGAPRAARAPVLAPASPRDEPLRNPARPRGARADRRQLQRSVLPRSPRESRGGRALRDRRADRVGDGAAADRVPHGLARLRLLDRGRRRGQADVRVRSHLSRRHRLLARAGAGAARALARAAADATRVLRGRASRRASRVRRRGLRGVHRDGDRRRPREADAIQLGDHRRCRRGQHRPEPPPDPALRDHGRGGRDRRGVRSHVHRDDLVRAARLPHAVPVAAGADRGGCCGGTAARREGARRPRRSDRLDASRTPSRWSLLGFLLPEERIRLREARSRT